MRCTYSARSNPIKDTTVENKKEIEKAKKKEREKDGWLSLKEDHSEKCLSILSMKKQAMSRGHGGEGVVEVVSPGISTYEGEKEPEMKFLSVV